MRSQYLRTVSVCGLAVIAALAGANLADAKAKPKHKHAHPTAAPVSMMVRGPSMLVLKRRDGVPGGQINVTEAKATSADGSVHFSYSYQDIAYKFPASARFNVMGPGNVSIGETTIDVPQFCTSSPEPQPRVDVKVSRPIGQIVGYTLVQTSAGLQGTSCRPGPEH